MHNNNVLQNNDLQLIQRRKGMSIRSAVKVIVIKDEKILLIKYISESGVVYYELPGGGQEQFEEMEDTARREFLEETGLNINIRRFAAIAEEIFRDEALRRYYPNYAHRIHHIYMADLISDDIRVEKDIVLDKNQIGCEWVPIEQISKIYLIPQQIREHFNEVINSNHPVYLGTAYETAEFM